MPKKLRHGTSGFTSHPKEGVLRIFIVIKNPSPRPGLNRRPVGSVARTLTTAPPTQHNLKTEYSAEVLNTFSSTSTIVIILLVASEHIHETSTRTFTVVSKIAVRHGKRTVVLVSTRLRTPGTGVTRRNNKSSCL
jgi:hypothetical protein